MNESAKTGPSTFSSPRKPIRIKSPNLRAHYIFLYQFRKVWSIRFLVYVPRYNSYYFLLINILLLKKKLIVSNKTELKFDGLLCNRENMRKNMVLVKDMFWYLRWLINIVCRFNLTIFRFWQIIIYDSFRLLKYLWIYPL